MTFEEAKMTIYANVVYACEEAGFTPMTIKLVKDACDTVIALAEQADTPQTEEEGAPYICDTCKYSDKEWYEQPCECCHNNSGYKPKDEPQTDCGWK